MKLLKRAIAVLPILTFWVAPLGPLNAQSIDSKTATISAPEAPPSGDQDHPPAGNAISRNLNQTYGPMAPLITAQPLSAEQKWAIYAHQAFGPPAVVLPAFGAGIRMANPPKDYPPEWIDGAGGFGREYGDAVAVQESTRVVALFTELAFHEDPRYAPAKAGTNLFVRFAHATAFTLFDQTDSGHRTLALKNFAGAAAGGFVGNAYLPDSFTTASRAGQRATIELGRMGIANVLQEFQLVQKLHLPKILPAWWVPEHPQQP